jgi:hypothetical protein
VGDQNNKKLTNDQNKYKFAATVLEGANNEHTFKPESDNSPNFMLAEKFRISHKRSNSIMNRNTTVFGGV